MDKKYAPVVQTTAHKRIEMVKDIFSTIPRKYDFLNHLLSLRRDVRWRRVAAGKMHFFRTYRFLDVATGTADLAIEAVMRYPHIRVTGLDFVEEMIRLARKKIEKKGLFNRVEVFEGNALHIPLTDESFDAAGMAFGIRNIPDKTRALREMARVVVPGGQVLILEMTFPRAPFLSTLYKLYLNRVLPFLARAFSPNPDAYYYLGDSIMNFPTAYEFSKIMEKAGLKDVAVYPLTLGIAHLYVGYKPGADAPGRTVDSAGALR